MILTRWAFYCDIPIGFGKQIIVDAGWVGGDWIGCVGWRFA